MNVGPVDQGSDLTESGEGERATLSSVNKALFLLDSFRRGGADLGVSELARRAGVSKSTAFRLLAYLEQGGYVERAGKNYRVGWRVFELGNRVHHCRPRGLRDIAVPYLSELYAQTKHAANLSVLEGTDVVYLEKIHGPQTLRIPTAVGGRFPASCTGLGKAILAFSPADTVRPVLERGMVQKTAYSIAQPGRLIADLNRIRAEGLAFDREEAAPGLACVAAPIMHDGKAIAAISVSGFAGRFNTNAIAAQVRRAAAQISREYRP